MKNEFRKKCVDNLIEKIDYWGENIKAEDLENFYEDLVSYMIDEEDLKLYRYSPINYYSIRNFETGRLCLTPNGEFNDVYEGIPLGWDRNIENKEISKFGSIAHLKCFSQNWNNDLMWSYYANSHSGICIEYDLSLLEKKSIVLKHLYPVIYSENRVIYKSLEDLISILKDYDDAKHNDEDVKEFECIHDAILLFLYKNKKWEYEEEWRVIFTDYEIYESNNENSNIIDFDCISAVYLGCRISLEHKDHIIEIANRLNQTRSANEAVKVYQLSLGKTTYSLEKEQLL